MALVTLEDVKAKLGIPESVTKFDDTLQCEIDALCCEVLAFLCLDAFEPTQYQLIADLDEPPFVCPPTTLFSEPQPVLSVDEVDNGGCILDPKHYRWFKKDGSIRLLCGAWAQEDCCGKPARVKLTAGFTPGSNLEACLKNAMIQQIAATHSGPSGLFKKETIGRYSYELQDRSERGNSPAHWVPALYTVLQPYQRLIDVELLEREC